MQEDGYDERCGRILRELGIDPAMFVAVPARPGEEADHIFSDLPEEAIDGALVE